MQTGARIGRYEVLCELGRGGMGEVWKARDTKLLREVAIKMLPPDLAHEARRLARLESEAKILAALNHPNVAAILGIEEHEGSLFLVLELVEGITLADRLRAGPMPVRDALDVALQIAAGLEAAHDKGIAHRDLKPANVNVTAEGRVKVLDFGLAATVAPEHYDGVTRTACHAAADVGAGTAPYMSPEQARGELASRQSDIWSFGVVLYEMLSGVSPFERPTSAETLARVLEAQPDYGLLPPGTPAGVRNLIRRCLEKSHVRRFRDIGDVRIQLEDAIGALDDEATALQIRSDRRSKLLPAAAAVAGLALVGVAGFGIWSMTRQVESDATSDVIRFSIPATGTRFFTGFGVKHVAVSADGSRVAHAFGDQLFVRELHESESVAIPVGSNDPFFSPDGEWVGFLSNGVYKVPSDGGRPMALAPIIDRPTGADWGEDGTIVFGTSAGLYQVSEDGGTPRLLAKPDPARDELLYAWPQLLPGGRSLLFTIVPRGSIAGAQTARLDLETLEIEPILTGAVSAQYVVTGHLVYAAGSTLMAVVFDLETYKTRGEPVALRDVTVATTEDNGAAEFAVADNGTLAFIRPQAPPPSVSRSLAWVDREGNEEPLALEPGPYVYARVSPDGTRVAVDVNHVNRDIWIWDIGRETFTRLTDGPTEDMTPIWSRDSRRVFFASDRTGNFDLYSQPADGSAEATVEFVAPTFEAPNSMTPDGTRVVVTQDFRDLAVVDLGENTLRPLLQRDAIDWLGEVSPDGRFVAYESDESGAQFEVYVRSFPDVTERREKVSIDGGRYARWGPPGSNELYYVALDGSMMAVPIEVTPTLRVGRATKLFDFVRPPRGASARFYDVSDVDGRFLIVRFGDMRLAETMEVSIVLDWSAELRAQIPQ